MKQSGLGGHNKFALSGEGVQDRLSRRKRRGSG